jgi:hypothetical protein
MLLRFNLYTLLGGLLALLSVVTALPADSAARLGDAWGKSPFAKLWYSNELKRSADLDGYVATIESRHRQRREVAEKVRDGHMSLIQAAARWKFINRLPGSSYYGEFDWPALSENERLCRQVIQAVEFYSNGMPTSQRSAILERLETELRDNRDCYGNVTLPEESEVRQD